MLNALWSLGWARCSSSVLYFWNVANVFYCDLTQLSSLFKNFLLRWCELKHLNNVCVMWWITLLCMLFMFENNRMFYVKVYVFLREVSKALQAPAVGAEPSFRKLICSEVSMWDQVAVRLRSVLKPVWCAVSASRAKEVHQVISLTACLKY